MAERGRHEAEAQATEAPDTDAQPARRVEAELAAVITDAAIAHDDFIAYLVAEQGFGSDSTAA
jgi:hypothetical protein